MKKKKAMVKWRGETVHMGDFLFWLEQKEYNIRFVDQIWRNEDCLCEKCDKPHKGKGWGWVYATAMCFVCDEQIKREIPPKTADEWDAYGR